MLAKQSTNLTWEGTILCLILLMVLGGCANTTPSPDRPFDTPLAPVSPPSTESPPGESILRLDIGGHTAPFKRIDVDAEERNLVTGSDDKLVRVWFLAEGAHVQTLRVPIDRGNEDKLYAVALSPDGQTVAVGAILDGTGMASLPFLSSTAQVAG